MSNPDQGTEVPDEDVVFFALVILDTCDAVAAGETSWEDEIVIDIGNGAPPEDAIGFNDFLRDVFCAQVT